MQSPFFLEPKLLENDLCFCIEDGFPVSRGHCLVIPKRVYADYFESTEEEIKALWKMVSDAKTMLEYEHSPDGFNIGINCGQAAGQTIMHMHIHVIPRYRGDTEKPKGGVRGVIPRKMHY